jgi:predicted negative regulator of RcsB-dependent stress response
MAQASRTAPRSSSVYTDDPLENAITWLRIHSKPIALVVGGIVLPAAAIMVYRASEASKRERAFDALYAAQGPISEGKLTEAGSELRKVIQRYGGTSAGQQAVLLLAQLEFEQNRYDEGIAVLQSARGSASREFAASMDALIAAGHEGAGNHDQAAEAFAKAASSAVHASDRAQYEAAQARALMSAGKLTEARAIWSRLAEDESQPVSQEAQVRLGEIIGAGK